MGRLIRWLIYLLLLAAAAFVAYAYVGPVLFPDDFAPVQEVITTPAELGSDQGGNGDGGADGGADGGDADAGEPQPSDGAGGG